MRRIFDMPIKYQDIIKLLRRECVKHTHVFIYKQKDRQPNRKK